MKLVKYEAKKLAAVAFMTLASPVVMAGDPGWYIGGGVGESRANINEEDISNSLSGSGFTTSAFTEDEYDGAYKLFGGYQFNDYFSLEAGYFDLGDFGFQATTIPAGTLSGDIALKGLNFDLVGSIPFTEKLSAFGRVGLSYTKTKDSFSGTGAVVAPDSSPEESEPNYKAGLGLEYDFTRSLSMRIEAERYRVDDAVGDDGDIDVASIGLVYRFGESKPAAKPAPEQVVEKPAPAPAAVVVVPAKVKTAEYCSLLEIEYEIDQDVIQDQEKEKLAVLGKYMKKYPDTTAVIEGHTDDVGTMKYNQELSQQRADSVVKYLVNDMQIASSRLSAVGYGEGNPQSDNSAQGGKKSNRRINAVISCATDVEGLAVAYPRITMAMEIDFDPYKSNIEPKYYEGLGKVADYLMTHPAITATVEGHSGKYLGTGDAKVEVSKETSMEVSERRANRVVDYLVSRGVARSRLTAEAFGQSRRVAYGTTLAGQQENRRVNIIFNYPTKK